KHPPSDPTVSRDDTHLSLDLESLTNDGRKVIQHLRQVSAGLALGQNRRRKESGVNDRHALRERAKRVRNGHTKVLTVVHQSKLRADRIRQFRADHLYAGREGVAGSQRARKKIDRLWKLFFELDEATVSHEVHVAEWQVRG